jgi:pimeloyl-ACP methyl ester carboxylesterase
MSLSNREAAEVARVNDSGRQPILLVHGLWLLAGSWQPWEELLEDRGYAAMSIEWPGDPVGVEAARAEPQAMAGTTVTEVADHVVEVIAELDRRPVVIGHSFGGLLAQIVAGRGLSIATVAIDPAPFKGVLPLPLSTLRASFPVLSNPANRNRAVTLTREQFIFGFANAVSKAEAASLYDEHHVAAPGRPLFEAALANISWARGTAVDTKNRNRGPLLIVSGGEDHTVPWPLANAAYKKQAKNPGVTEIIEIEGVGHSLVIDSNWKQVAETALTFLERNEMTP